MRSFQRGFVVFAGGCSLIAISVSQDAAAQTIGTPNHQQPPRPQDQTVDVSVVPDIIVTAEKRSERLQDVPMSITAATSDQLRSQGVTSTEQLEKVVSGFTLNKTNHGQTVFIIRGVGFNDGTAGASSTVAAYVDQIPVPFSSMARGTVLDLDRVEVLKGPQGTLFGQNSTGGAINFIAAKPTKTLESGFDLTVGRFNQVDAEAFVSGPLTDTLSVRLAVRNEYRGDWQRGYTVDERRGAKDFQNGRLLIDWRPSSRLKIEVSASGWKDRSDAQQAQFIKFQPLNPAGLVPFPIATFPAAPNDARAAAWDPGRDYRQDNYFYQFAGNVEYEVSDHVRLTSLTSYVRFGEKIPTDFDSTVYPVTGNLDTARIHSFSQELRLSGEVAAGSIKWMAGANYAEDNSSERFIQDPLNTSNTKIGPYTISALFVDSDQRVKTKAIFGSLDYDIGEHLVLQGSVRYTKQDRDFSGCSRDSGNGTLAAALGFLSTALTGLPQSIQPGACATLDTTTHLPLPIVTGELNQDNVSWRLGASYKFNADALLYANVTKGFKSGSYPTIPAIFTSEIAPVGQESVLAYEAGFKLSAFSRKVQFDAAAFYYDYKDKQVLGYVNIPPFGPIPALVSVPKSVVRGAEASLIVRPLSGLAISGNVSYIDTEIKSNPPVPNGAFGNSGDFRGQSFPNTPKWQGVFDAQYKFDTGSTTDAYVGISATARSATSGILRSGTASVAALEDLASIPGYALIDLRAGIEANDGRWRAEIWGRNVSNKFYITAATKSSDYVTRYAGMPATYGITLSYRYK